MKTCHWGSWENFMLGEYLNVNTAYTEFLTEIWLTTVCISYDWSLQDSLLRLKELMSRSPSVATQTYCRARRLDPRTSCCVSGWIKHTQMISHTDAPQLAFHFQYDATETPAEEMMAQRSSSQKWKCYWSDWLPPSTPMTGHLPQVTFLPVSWSDIYFIYRAFCLMLKRSKTQHSAK